MKEHFLLQFKMLSRKMIDFGLPLLIRFTLLTFVFILLSNHLFVNTEFAVYVYGLIAISFVSKLSEPKRNDFLKLIFNKDKYRKLRVIENIIYCLPFTLFLVYKNKFAFSSILNLLVIIITLFDFSTNITQQYQRRSAKNRLNLLLALERHSLFFQ